ncbi:hypothetical protein ACFRAQ_35845 [Nocardia sp. NPDC056611]|uniref:hypothetical protein n=1 Tax=Nocardia sp. NPDC056611 TaxID=3345877 RepID=UPI00366FBA6B
MIDDPVAAAEQRVVEANRVLQAARDECDQALDAFAIEVSRAHARMEQLNKELGDA